MKLICVDKVREGFIKEGVEHFLKSINYYSKFEIVRIKKSKPEREGPDILSKINNKPYIVLSEEGKLLDSIQFSDLIKKLPRDTTFVIGGTDGLSNEIKSGAKEIISLSKMTFTHEMAQLFFLEQIYRHNMIIKNKKYHR